MSEVDQRLLRVGVFYDGNFFFHVSNYYKYVHTRQKWISIPGFHEFIRHRVAEAEGVDVRYCQIVDAHFFRGRIWAKEAEARQKLYVERVFEDILMAEGIVTHHLPIRQGQEKGIDVWLSLEAYELAVYKRFNVLVLIAGDSDFIPLARKVNSLGTRVMVLGWDFDYIDKAGIDRQTVTSIHLLDEVTYPVMMHTIIDDKTRRDDALIKGLFAEHREGLPTKVRGGTSEPAQERASEADPDRNERSTGSHAGWHLRGDSSASTHNSAVPKNAPEEKQAGEILGLQKGFGFIKCPRYPDNLFFHWSALLNRELGALQKGQKVVFTVGLGDKGPFATAVEVMDE